MPVKTSGPGVFSVGKFLIMDLISLRDTGLFTWSVSSYDGFGKLYFSRNLFQLVALERPRPSLRKKRKKKKTKLKMETYPVPFPSSKWWLGSNFCLLFIAFQCLQELKTILFSRIISCYLWTHLSNRSYSSITRSRTSHALNTNM